MRKCSAIARGALLGVRHFFCVDIAGQGGLKRMFSYFECFDPCLVKPCQMPERLAGKRQSKRILPALFPKKKMVSIGRQCEISGGALLQ